MMLVAKELHVQGLVVIVVMCFDSARAVSGIYLTHVGADHGASLDPTPGCISRLRSFRILHPMPLRRCHIVCPAF